MTVNPNCIHADQGTGLGFGGGGGEGGWVSKKCAFPRKNLMVFSIFLYEDAGT